MQRFLSLLLVLGLLVSSLFFLSSYSHHSSVGIDHDFVKEDRILAKFYRVNWTGHGSVWLGYGSRWKEKDETKELEKFDLAAAFFKPQNKTLQTTSFWNRIGFWFIHVKSSKPSFWLGIPSWLPVLFFLILLFIQGRKIKKVNSYEGG